MQRWNRVILLSQIAGLCGTAWVIYITTLFPAAHRWTWGLLIGRALGFSLIAWACSAGISLLLYLALPSVATRELGWTTLRTSAAAIWFAPAILLLSRPSILSLTAALTLVVSATRLLYSQWVRIHPDRLGPTSAPVLAGIFDEPSLPPRVFVKEVAPALTIGCLLEAGVVGIVMQDRFLAEALLVTGCALATIIAISRGAWRDERAPSLPRSIFGMILTVLLASTLTVGGLSHLIRHRLRGDGGDGSGDGDTSATQTASASKPGADGTEAGHYEPQPPTPSTGFADGSFPGVILWPEIKKVTRIVAPPPANNGAGGVPARPYSIPFGGEYWMYRSLVSRRPPANSFFQRGSPASLAFSTTDRWPLQMEARQKLDQPLDLHCCGKVRIEIWNADRYPGTVALELVAVDEEEPGEPWVSLGLAPVESTPNLKNDPVMAVPETLEFSVPADLKIPTCTAFKVVFRRNRDRADRSARIAIDRFVLQPRGS